jgi:hypothetical protein
MRRPVSRKARAPQGARVIVECTLPEGQLQGIVSVYTGSPGYDLSPYVDPEQIGILSKERPIMLKPFYTTLRPEKPAHTFEFTATEDMYVQVIQDVDLKTDASAKAKVKVNGKLASKIRWLLRDAFGAIRNGYASLYRRNPG